MTANEEVRASTSVGTRRALLMKHPATPAAWYFYVVKTAIFQVFAGV
jgi:hypothetical protein